MAWVVKSQLKSVLCSSYNSWLVRRKLNHKSHFRHFAKPSQQQKRPEGSEAAASSSLGVCTVVLCCPSKPYFGLLFHANQPMQRSTIGGRCWEQTPKTGMEIPVQSDTAITMICPVGTTYILSIQNTCCCELQSQICICRNPTEINVTSLTHILLKRVGSPYPW